MIKRVTEDDYDVYEQFLNSHSDGHFMQTIAWKRFKSRQESFALMSVDENGAVCGEMLMFVQNVRHTKARFLYCPRGPICDRHDTQVLGELLSEAAKIAEEIGAYKLTLDPDITGENSEWLGYFEKIGARVGDNARDNGILQPFSVFRINIENKTDEELIASFHSKARYSVRSSIKSGAVCRLGTREDIPIFCALLASTAERDGFTARKPDYFYEMYDSLGDDMMKLFIVEYDGAPIAGSVLIKFGNKSWHMYAGSSDEHKEVLPNFLMQWEMMRWSIKNGVALYDMRGIAGEGDKLKPLEGLVRFKKRFGGELITFVGRIDIVYDRAADRMISTLKSAFDCARKIIGRNRKK